MMNKNKQAEQLDTADWNMWNVGIEPLPNSPLTMENQEEKKETKTQFNCKQKPKW